MTDEPITPDNTPTDEQLATAQFGLPIEHLFIVDPLDITSDDLLLIVTHFRNTRFQHLKAMEKPKAVQKNRNPKLDAEATKKELDSLMSDLGFE